MLIKYNEINEVNVPLAASRDPWHCLWANWPSRKPLCNIFSSLLNSSRSAISTIRHQFLSYKALMLTPCNDEVYHMSPFTFWTSRALKACFLTQLFNLCGKKTHNLREHVNINFSNSGTWIFHRKTILETF